MIVLLTPITTVVTAGWKFRLRLPGLAAPKGITIVAVPLELSVLNAEALGEFSVAVDPVSDEEIADVEN